MKRRKLLKYTALGTSGLILAACTGRSSQESDQNTPKFGKLEKTYLTLGYVPTTEAAPLIIAQEKGFFARYGLKVGFSRQPSSQELEKGLKDGKLDGAIAPFALPLLSQLSQEKTPLISLMTVNLNGSAITLSQKAWKGGIRPRSYYTNFPEFGRGYRSYIQKFSESPSLAITAKTSLDHYLYRYWLAAMGIDPDRQIKLIDIPPSQLIHKLEAGTISGYCASEPFNQQAVWEKAGFTVEFTRNIWKGHPGQILATMQPWVKDNPNTARALVAAMLEACKYCDRLENRPEIAQIIAQNKYLNMSLLSIEPALVGNYTYGQLDPQEKKATIPDFNIFHFQETSYLKKPNNANYPLLSHGVWLLTQMIRWGQIDLKEYPKDADKILEQAYPVEIYEEVAKALKIDLPKEKMKKEPATAFIDQREFDPSQPVAYLNQFELRA